MTESRGARRHALRGLVGALMVVGAAAAVMAANMSLLLYADGRGARTGPLYSRAELRPATGVAAGELRAQEYAREAPGRQTADPVPRATERPRPRRQGATADREPQSPTSQAKQNAGEQARGGVVEATQQELDKEEQKPAEELDRAQKEKERAFQRELRAGEKELEREQGELEKKRAKAGKEEVRPATATPAGEHDDD